MSKTMENNARANAIRLMHAIREIAEEGKGERATQVNISKRIGCCAQNLCQGSWKRGLELLLEKDFVVKEGWGYRMIKPIEDAEEYFQKWMITGKEPEEAGHNPHTWGQILKQYRAPETVEDTIEEVPEEPEEEGLETEEVAVKAVNDAKSIVLQVGNVTITIALN